MQLIFKYLPLLLCITQTTSNVNPFDDTILYRIKWPGANDKLSKSLENLNPDSAVIGVTDKLEKYICLLPDLSQTEKDFDALYAGPNPLDLLAPLFAQSTCSYRLESYWTYEVCHGKYVKQYHEERDSKKYKKQEYYLGRWDGTMKIELIKRMQNIENLEQAIKTKKIEGMDVPYFQLNYTDGTVCDLNDKPRQTNVLYICFDHGRHDIYSIKEISTCHYEAIIFTPLLCNHPLYKRKNSGQKDINCTPFSGTSKKPSGLLSMEAESFKLRHEQFLDREQALKKVLAVFSVDKGDGQEGEARLHVQIHPLDTLTEITVPAKHPLETINPKTFDVNVNMLDFVSGKECLRGKSGFWDYEVCYGKHVVQFHEEIDGSRLTIDLGTFSLEEHKKWLIKNSSKKYKKNSSVVSHFYSKGSFCDEVGVSRETEVRFKCLQNQGGVSRTAISLHLTEPRLCRYVLHVESTGVCKFLSSLNEYGLFENTKVDGLKRPDDTKVGFFKGHDEL